MQALTRERIIALFKALNEELSRDGTRGDLYLVGGAVMCVALDARAATQDVDAAFRPTAEVRRAASRVARTHNLPETWLNDGVKGFMSTAGEFVDYLELSHLCVMVASPEYLLAMKCLSLRLGPEFADEADVRFLLRYLNIESADQAWAHLERFYPADRYPPKTGYMLAEICQG